MLAEKITVGQFFGTLPIEYHRDSTCSYFDRVGFDRLTDGTLNRYAQPCRSYKHWPELIACCKEIIARIEHLPFAGRITLARIMADAMELLKQKHNLPAPPPWYPAIKKLRAEKHKPVHV